MQRPLTYAVNPVFKKESHQKGTRAVKKLNSFRNTLTDQEPNDASLNGLTSPTSPNKALNLGLNPLPDLAEHFYEYQHSSPDIAPPTLATMKVCEQKLMRHLNVHTLV